MIGAALSARMDFSVEDRAPEMLLNDIIWRSVKGARPPISTTTTIAGRLRFW